MTVSKRTQRLQANAHSGCCLTDSVGVLWTANTCRSVSMLSPHNWSFMLQWVPCRIAFTDRPSRSSHRRKPLASKNSHERYCAYHLMWCCARGVSLIHCATGQSSRASRPVNCFPYHPCPHTFSPMRCLLLEASAMYASGKCTWN